MGHAHGGHRDANCNVEIVAEEEPQFDSPNRPKRHDWCDCEPCDAIHALAESKWHKQVEDQSYPRQQVVMSWFGWSSWVHSRILRHVMFLFRQTLPWSPYKYLRMEMPVAV